MKPGSGRGGSRGTDMDELPIWECHSEYTTDKLREIKYSMFKKLVDMARQLRKCTVCNKVGLMLQSCNHCVACSLSPLQAEIDMRESNSNTNKRARTEE